MVATLELHGLKMRFETIVGIRVVFLDVAICVTIRICQVTEVKKKMAGV